MPNYYKSLYQNMPLEKLFDETSGQLRSLERAQLEYLTKELAKRMQQLMKDLGKF